MPPRAEIVLPYAVVSRNPSERKIEEVLARTPVPELASSAWLAASKQRPEAEICLLHLVDFKPLVPEKLGYWIEVWDEKEHIVEDLLHTSLYLIGEVLFDQAVAARPEAYEISFRKGMQQFRVVRPGQQPA